MAEYVILDASITVNAVDLSDHCKSVTLSYDADMVDSTSMSATQSRDFLPGLTNWNISVEFGQDYATSKVDATLFPLIGAAAFECIVIADGTAGVSATNPSFTGNTLLQNYQPVQGSVGDHATTTITLQGTGAITRATS